MQSIAISVIVPFYNAKKHLVSCINNIDSQNFKETFEIILVNDGSTDISHDILKKKFKKFNLKLYSYFKNKGPAAARNFGLKKAKGEYVFFLDVDDTIENSTLSELFNKTKEKKFDLIFCDRKWIEKSKNIRNGKYFYSRNKTFNENNIKNIMKKKFYDPSFAVGLFHLTGRLIKRSIITKNKIYFENKLRYFEDEAFEWDLIGSIKNACYVRKQLYCYFLNNNINTGLSSGILKGFPLKNYDIVESHVISALKKKKISNSVITSIKNQAYIFLIISSLISFTRSTILGKINLETSLKYRRILINNILKSNKVNRLIEHYKISSKESKLIIRAIKLKSIYLLEKACDLRAKEIIYLRRKKSKKSDFM